MSLENWLKEGWLARHHCSKDEARQVLGNIKRNLANAHASGLTSDGVLMFAYNAVFQCAYLALAAEGYRPGSGPGHHYYTINSLRYTMKLPKKDVNIIDGFLEKRNISVYQQPDIISTAEAKDLLDTAERLQAQLIEWLTSEHPELIS